LIQANSGPSSWRDPATPYEFEPCREFERPIRDRESGFESAEQLDDIGGETLN